MIGVCLLQVNEDIVKKGVERGVVAKLIPEEDGCYWNKISIYLASYCEALSR